MALFPFFSAETWALMALCLTLFCVYGWWPLGFFKELGIPGPKPLMYWGTVNRHNIVYYIDDYECSKKYGKVWGSFEFRRPVLVVMDPSMLKTILVKECFTYFTNRRNLVLNGDLHDAVSVSEDNEWRRIRSILSPSFTSGRIKEMYDIMTYHCKKMMDSLRTKAENDEVIAVKEFFGPYNLDVMLSSAFSLENNSVNNPSKAMITHIEDLFKFPIPLFLFLGFFPFLFPLFKALGFSFFSKSATTYFISILKKIRAERHSGTHKSRVDFLQLMLDSQKGNDSKGQGQHQVGLSDHEILSQAIIFVFAGYETSSITLSFLAYNLGMHPDVMERLQEEIDATFPDKTPVQYEALMQMEYLDSVVCESLRLYPPAPRLERVAKATVKINGITIPTGTFVMVPTYAMHRDADLWTEPEEFRPDRFSKENKKNIDPYTFLPFGLGPRNCIGMRFALVQIKLALVEVLRSYSFAVCKETEIPLEMSPEGLLGPVRPIKMKIVPRSKA